MSYVVIYKSEIGVLAVGGSEGHGRGMGRVEEAECIKFRDVGCFQ